MKKVTFILLFLISLGIIYSMFSFVIWEFNPGKWTDDARFFLVMMDIIIIVIFIGIGIEEFKDKK